VHRICEKPYLRIFESIPPTSSVVDHSMRVSLLSTFLGYQLGFVNPIALEHLAAAGLLHDIGKTRVALDGNIDVTPEQEKLIEKMHPRLGADLLRKSPNVPEEVITIVVQHHEKRDGTGIPNGLRGPKIDGLTKVLSIANTFDNLISELPGDRETRAKLAAEKMEREMRSWFEPLLLSKATRLLTSS
jgi:putative nucleotidyltransferase with HDIG domain